MTLRALSTAATGMKAQSINVDVIANNLANVNTSGYKKQKANFEDLLYQQIRAVGTTTPTNTKIPTGLQVGMGTQLVSVQRYFEEQGAMDQTGRKLDVAILGDGFFQVVLDAQGNKGYTRAGAFTRDQDGRLLDPHGHPLDPEILVDTTVSVDKIQIAEDGRVLFQPNGQTDFQEAGQISLARFANAEGLQAIGENLFKASQASGDPIVDFPGSQGLGHLAAGNLEDSNVDLVKELTDMIKAQRAYEINSESIKTADQMLQTATNLRR